MLSYLLSVLLVGMAAAKVQFVGMNIAGFDSGCGTDGTCSLSGVSIASNATAQITHFVTDDQMNIFRFPVSWQFLTNDNVGGTLDATKFGQYDQVMQSCLKTESYCAIDIHNYARVSNQIIGQGGPTDAQFADLWSQLATRYMANENVIFGLMNEPHDVDINIWATTLQAAVTAIRGTGATSQMVLLPGNDFTSASQFISSGSGAALLGVTNPDSSTTGLIMDFHRYLDVDNSGEHAVCTTDSVADAFAGVATFLRSNGRQGIVSETGSGSNASCFTAFCAQNDFLNANSDVFLGYVAWAAGDFSSSYVLNLTPTQQDGKYFDNTLTTQCVIGPWLNSTDIESVTASGTLTTITQVSTYTRTTTVTIGIATISGQSLTTALYLANATSLQSVTSPAVISGVSAATSVSVQITSAASLASVWMSYVGCMLAFSACILS